MSKGQNNMKRESGRTVQEAWRSLAVSASVDVVVVGGGPAGVACAIAAARNGAKTVLVEQFGYLGGMATAGLVPAFCPYTDGKALTTRGVGLEILDAMKAEMPHIKPDHYDWVPIDPELLKWVLDEKVGEAGAEVSFLTHFVDVVKGGSGEIDSVVVHNKSGLQRIDAKMVVDCTGDGDVAASAGAPFEKGDRQSGRLQPCTMCFVLAGIDNGRLLEFLWADGGRNLLLKEVIAEAKAAGDLKIAEVGANVAYQSASTIGLNFSHVFDVDATDAEELSHAHVEGRRLIRHLTEFMRKYCPGCEKAFLVNSGVHVGVRETRRIVGEYVLTVDDYLARRTFDDDIARNSYYIDIHSARAEYDEVAKHDKEQAARIEEYQPGEFHGIPYRCLIPRGVKNMLVAGRCISTDREVQGAVRVMPVCFSTGEAAGAAAAMVVGKGDNDPRGVDVVALRGMLPGCGGGE